MYRAAFNHFNQIVIFQNQDDAKVLLDWGVLSSNKIRLLKGSGVELKNFTYLKESSGIPVVCFAARLLIDKGVKEYISAANGIPIIDKIANKKITFNNLNLSSKR